MQRNVLYITIDALRADRVSHLGYGRSTTPTLDDLAESGTTWTQAVASGVPTYFSFKSLLGGIHALSHGSTIGLPNDGTSVSEAFQQRGYTTAGFNAGNPWLTPAYGYDRGFDTFQDFLTAGSDGRGLMERLHSVRALIERNQFVRDTAGLAARLLFATVGRQPLEPAEHLTDSVIEWLRSPSTSSGPTFCWVHYMDPHYPWVPRDEELQHFRETTVPRRTIGRLWHKVSHLENEQEGTTEITQEERAMIDDLYDAEVRRVDTAIGRLLEAVEETLTLEETLVVVVADHGTELLDHGGFSHAPRSLYDEVVHVPLILHGPDVPTGVRTETASLVDLPPTVLRRSCNSSEPTFEGGSLFRRTDEPTITEVVYDYDPSNDSTGRSGGNGSPLTACIDWPWKLVENQSQNSRELYHLKQDPGERIDRSADHDSVVSGLSAAISDHRKWLERRNRTVAEKRRVRELITSLKERGAV
jgi:arylsulfatase A-like enzyme